MTDANAENWTLHEPICARYYQQESQPPEGLVVGCQGPQCEWRSDVNSYSFLGFADHLEKIGAPAYMVEYWRSWAQFVELPFGTLHRDAVARELSDYDNVMHNATAVYSELASLSKANTAPEYIIEASEQRSAERYADFLCDHAWNASEEGDTKLCDALVDIAEGWHQGAWVEFQQARTASSETPESESA